MEFGVAGGSGLLALEECSTNIQKLLSIDIEIYGFDMGTDLLEPLDYRGLLYVGKKNFTRWTSKN